MLSDSLDQLSTVLLHYVHEVVWDGHFGEGHALVLLIPDHGLAGQQVHNACKVILSANGHLKWNRVGTQHLANLLEHIEEVST